MTGQRVLVVDDEPQIQRFLAPALTAAGYEVVSAATGREALRMIATNAPDVVVLDLGLPDIDGKDVLKDARAFSSAPVIVLSARDREAEKIAALDLGADDYVEKPFAIGELLARLRAALRRRAGGPAGPETFEVDGLTVDLNKRRVTKNGATVKLTPREYDVLAVLARHAGRVVTHGRLLASVWGPAHRDDTQYLRVFIGQLRAKIEDDPAAPRIIKTESGVGYRFGEA
ncbi:MAG TPA: response regulator transcription factor [Roseiarcus sp.]|nr:response regulator transcription factor [Roseiarcus sp.]